MGGWSAACTPTGGEGERSARNSTEASRKKQAQRKHLCRTLPHHGNHEVAIRALCDFDRSWRAAHPPPVLVLLLFRRKRCVGFERPENIDLKPHEIARQAERKRGLPPSSCLSPLSRYGVFMVPQTMAAFSSKRGAAGSTRAAVAARRTSSDNSSSSFGLVCQKELGLGRDNGMPHLSCCRPRAPLRAIPLHDPFMLAAVLFHFAPALYGCDAVAQND